MPAGNIKFHDILLIIILHFITVALRQFECFILIEFVLYHLFIYLLICFDLKLYVQLIINPLSYEVLVDEIFLRSCFIYLCYDKSCTYTLKIISCSYQFKWYNEFHYSTFLVTLPNQKLIILLTYSSVESTDLSEDSTDLIVK